MKKALLLLTFYLLTASVFAQADIVVTNTNNQSAYVAGTSVTYTVTVTNFGPAVATNIQVENQIPAAITTFYWEGSNNTFGSNVDLFNVIPTLQAGEFVTYVINLDIPQTFTGNLVSKATANAASPADNFPQTNESTDTDTVANADVKVVTTDNTSVYVPGENTVYTVTVTNDGPTDAVNIIVKNDRPAGINAAQFSWTGSNGSSGTGTALEDTILLLGNGATVTYTITVQVPLTFTGSLINKTNLFVTSKDPTEDDWTSTDTDTRNLGADIVVTNTDNQDFYISGQQRVYTVKVTNMGVADATNVHVTDTFPVGITNITWTGSNGTNGTGPLDVTLPTLANQAVITYTVTVQVPTGFTGDLTSQVAVTSITADPNPDCNACIDIDKSGADIVVTNTNNQTEYVAGSTATYIVTVTNNGPSAATNVHISDSFPTGVTVISWTGSNGSTGGGTFNDIITTLANGVTVTYTINVQIPANLTTDLVSQVTVASDTPDPFPACTQCTDTDTSKKADLQVTYTDNKTVYVAGDTNIYTITITNNGPNAAENVSVSNLIPTGTTQFSWSGSNGSAGVNVPLTDTIPLLANGATVTYTITLLVPATYSTNLTSTVKITSGTVDPTPVVQIADVDTLSATGADVVVTNTDGQTTYLPGSTAIYTLTVTNNGPQDATGINLTNAIPAGVTVMTWSGNGGGGNGALADTIPSLVVGASVTYTISVQIPVGFSTDLISQAAITTTSIDPNPTCVNCTDKDVPATASDIVVTNTSNDAAPVKGTSTTFTVTVTNNGPGNATDVHVQNPLPAGITTMTWTGNNGSSGTGALDNTISVLPNGASVTYTITVPISVTFTGVISSTATATSVSVDPNPANSTATATTTPVGGNTIVITNTDGSPTYTAGQTRTYTVTVKNEGSAAVSNIGISSLLPAGITSDKYTWTGNSSSGSGAITNVIASLGAGQSVVYTIVVSVPENFNQDTNLITTVSATAATYNPLIATDIDMPQPYADIVVKKTDNKTTFNETRWVDDKEGDAVAPVRVLEYNEYIITIVNYGPSDAVNVVVSDPIPVNPEPSNVPVTAADVTWTGSNGSSGTGNLNDTISSLAVGESITYNVKVLVPENYNSRQPLTNNNFTNTVTVTSDTDDPVTSNNSSADVDTPAKRFLYVSNDPALYSVNGQLSGLAEGFVENVLVRSHCAQVSNFVMQSKPGDPSFGVAYFNRNNSDFPIADGIVIACGDVSTVPGPNDDGGIGQATWPGSTDFNPGFMTPEVGIPANTTFCQSFLKFDFVPSTSKLSFNFAFASDEYDLSQPTWKCTFSDVFAFVLTDITAGTQPKNLAVVPGTNTPVKVTTIHLPGCDNGQNPAYFGKYNKDLSNPSVAANSAIVSEGQTRLLRAESTVIPGHQYSIKLIIANQLDANVPSAVFIEGGSFAFDSVITGDDGSLDDFGIGREICYGEVKRLKMGDPLPGATYSWEKNGIKLAGETNNYLDVTSSGIYTATLTFATGCKKTDDIQVLFTDPFPLQDPKDITICDDTAPFSFNIDQTAYILDETTGTYDISYYENYDDAFYWADNNITNLTDYVINTEAELGKTIYARIADADAGNIGCVSIKPFILNSIINKGTISYPAGPFCVGGVPIDVINSADLTPGGKYVVTPSVGLTIDPATGKLTTDQQGTYSVTYTIEANAVCGEFSTPPVTIQVDPCISCNVQANGPTAVCMGDPINLTAVSTTNDTSGLPITYVWSGPYGFTSTDQNPSVSPLPTEAGSYTYQVISSVGSVPCPAGSVTVIVHPAPAAAFVSASTTICTNSSMDVVFEGTPDTLVTYTKTDSVTGTPVTETVLLDATGHGLVNTGNLTAAVTYELVKAATATTPACETLMTPGTAITISVGLPDATVSIADTVICSGGSSSFTITGTPGGIVDYTITTVSGSGPVTSPAIPISGTLTVTLSNLTEDTTITLTNITSTGSSSCSKALTGSVSVTVNPLPVASFSAALAAVCSGQPAELHFTGTPGATVTFTGGSPAVTYTTVLDALGASTVTAPDLPALTVGTTYTLQSIQSSDAVPCTNILSQSLTVGIKELPQITAPPPVIPVVCTGEPFTLSVSATGTAITYTWYHDTTAVGTGPTYTNPSPGVSDGGDYTVVVSNDCGTVTSGIYTVLINAPTVITVPPSGGGAVCAGQPIDLSITATGVGLSYQWYRDTVLLVGETNTALHIPSASAGDAGSYTCHVINTCQTVISNAVVFTVDQLPQITVPPSGPVAACTGTPFSLSVTATGTGLSYQWFHDGTAIPGPDAILPVYTVNSAVMSDAGAYTVEVSGTCSPSVTSAPVQVTISQAPGITGDPQGRVLCSGEALSLSVVATGGPGLTYQWERNGQPIAGATGPGLNIAVTAVSDSGLYHVIVANPGCAPITSADALVTVNQAPVIIDEPKDVNICLGDAIILTVTASGSNLSYQWMFNNLVPVGTDSHEFTIPVSAMGDSGNYTCIISSPSCPSIVSRVAEVFVNALPEATIANGIEPSICAGFSADVKITGTKNAVVSYTVNGGSVQTEPINPSGSLIIPTGDLYQDTVYELLSVKSDIAPFCEADLSGLATSTVVVRVNPLPAVSLEQEGYICIDSQTGATTKTFTYETGLDVADYSFKWFVDNVEIAGATGPSYEADEAGTYRVEVTDRVTGCEKKANAPLVSSSPPVSVSAEVVTNYFDENGTVEVTVEPAGEYEYRLDDGPWQDSNVFTNVRTILSLDQTGTHRLYARDLKACDEKYADITVIDYPKYFTPNGDGYHDTWNISVLSNQPNAKIYIFDRFGKLLKQISTTGSGWDGTFNGQPMPGDDYWFVVKYLEDTVNKEFKAHFSLKR